MYTSFCANTTGGFSTRSRRNKNQQIEPPTAEEFKEQGKFERASVLHQNQRLMHNKIQVKKVVNKSTFIVYHEDFRQEFFLKEIPDNEDVANWINVQTHTNIVTAFDQFVDEQSGHKFVMSEMTNGGNMYQYIESLNLDLAMDVPRSYLELVYDVGIQLATAMDFAHASGLVHGQLDLSEVLVHHNGDNLEFKITDFAPGSSMDIPHSSEANYWPFAKNKKSITDREKMEVLMLKDVYSLGICLLEMMIGRFSKNKFSISLDSLPLTWAEFPESTPLIQVLVECIQIDSITNRKGKLASIRKLLIREYKKHFQAQFYKMETPFIGKKSDYLNKKGVISLFHKKNTEQEACSFWQEALKLNDRHFDSKCNEVMYRWSTAKIGDRQMMAELDEFVFQAEHKGETFKAYLQIAQGDKAAGCALLKEYIERTKAQCKKDRITNTKATRSLKIAEDVLSAAQLDKDMFPQNSEVKHCHEATPKHISFSPDSGVLATTGDDCVKVWKFKEEVPSVVHTIKACEPADPSQCPMAFSSEDCSVVVVHRGKLIFTVYDCSGSSVVQKDQLDLAKEVQANGNPGFSLAAGDRVTDLRLMEKDSVLRVDFCKNKEHFLIDVQLADSVAKMCKIKQFEDRSAFSLEAGQGVSNIRELQANLKQLIEDELKAGNALGFPACEQNTVVVLNRDDPTQKFYTAFDIRRNGFYRRISKQAMESEAFAVDSTGKRLGYVDGEDLNVRSIRIPPHKTLVDTLRPRYQKAEMKLAPASASENKEFYKNKVYRDLHTYHMFKADPIKAEKQSGVTEEINVQLMVHKYEEATKRPYKMKANREFMMMMKVLLKEAVREKATHGKDNLQQCPLVGVLGTKRIEIYDDELTYINPNSKISFQEMSSEESRHFFLICMDQVVYKYDMVTKALMFQFKTKSSHAMIMYDKDDKLLCANDNMIRLWDFWDQKEQAPELITACESVLTVEKIFVNKNSKKCGGEDMLCLVTNQDQYALYKGRMDLVRQGSTEKHDNQRITVAEFDDDNKFFWLGTDKGLLICISVETGEEIGEAYNLCAELPKPITRIRKFVGVDTENLFLVVLNRSEALLYSHERRTHNRVTYGESEEEKSYEGKLICNARVAYNSKFFCIGLPQHRALGFFAFNRKELTSRPVKWLTKYAFSDFFMDHHLSQLMFLDEARKTLDHHVVLWDFDSSKLDDKHLRRIDNMKMPGAPKNRDCESESSEDENAEANKLLVEKLNAQSSCCTTF